VTRPVVKFRDQTLYNVKPPEFTQFGACIGVFDVEWLPDEGDPMATALGICNGTDDTPPCPVRAECLSHALAHPGPFGLPGIMGGTTEAERRTIKAAARAEHRAGASRTNE
jgi:hypothetical protein